MRKMESGQNRELYESLELGYLLDVESPAEDPLFRAGTSVYLRSTEGLINFFGDTKRDYPGSVAEGYGELASALVDQIEELVRVSDSIGDDETPQFETSLRVRPYPPRPGGAALAKRYKALRNGRAIPANRIYETEETSASKAFRGAFDALFLLREPRIVDIEDGRAMAIYKGKYMQVHPSDSKRNKYAHVELVETRGTDEIGLYREVALRIPRPQEALAKTSKKEPSVPFETTNELEERRRKRSTRWLGKWDDLLDRIIDLSEEEQAKVLDALGKRAEGDTDIQPVDAVSVMERVLGKQ